MEINRVLCVCMGNSDRSPVMTAVLQMFLSQAGDDAICESAGVHKSAKEASGGPAGKFAIEACRTIGLDITGHKRRHLDEVDLPKFDLFVCATDLIAEKVLDAGVPKEKIYNVNVTDPWPVQFPEDYESTMKAILGAMFQVMRRYFPAD